MKDLIYDYNKLKGRIKEKIGTQEHFAKTIQISNTSLSLKISNKRQWTQAEINRACRVLEIPDEEISDYFFTLKV